MNRAHSREALLLQSSARVGAMVSNYRLERLIAIGTSSAVYDARHADGSGCVLKLLHPALVASGDLRARWIAEHVPKTSGLPAAFVTAEVSQVSASGEHYVVLERLLGEGLESSSLRRSGGLPPLDALRLLEQLLETLAEVHSRGWYHGRLSLDDLFMEHGGRLRLRTLGALGQAAGDDATPLAEALGKRRDLWFSGVLTFALLSGHRSFQRSALTELPEAVTRGRLPSLAQLMPGLFPPLSAWVDAWVGAEARIDFDDAAKLREAAVALRLEIESAQRAVLFAVERQLPSGVRLTR